MSSKTSDARTYYLSIGHVNLTIIDTPGFGDTRGLKAEAEHHKRIKEAVIEEGGINCVCVVQNARAPRMDTQLTYSYSQLLDILPKTIAN